jgi:HSP20 family molecular chaperone IbpA
MEKMNREMNRIFDESFRDFRALPEYKGFFDVPRFGSALDLKEEGNNYVVRAYLPDREMQNVNASVEGQTLKIEASAENTGKNSDPTKGVVTRSKAHFSQVLTLPGPVQADKMSIDKKDGLVIITLPKA